MKRAALLAALSLLPVFAPAQEPVRAPLSPAAAAQAEERRAALLAEVAGLAARRPERTVCALVPANRRGLPAFKADSKGVLSLDVTVQVDLTAYRAWAAELSPRLRRLARDVETVRLVKEPAGYRFELPDREFDASQLVVVDGFSEIPRALGARVYTFDVATATEIRAAFRASADRAARTEILVQFRGPEGPLASVRHPFSLASSPGLVAPFVESTVRYQRFGSGLKAAKCPVLSFKSRKSFRQSLAKVETKSLRPMTQVWTACLPAAAAETAATAADPGAAPFRDVRGRFLRPRREAAVARAGEPADGEPAARPSRDEEERLRAAEARALRQRADEATAAAVRTSAAAFFRSVQAGKRGAAAATAVAAFETGDLSVACVDAVRERPGSPDLLVTGEAYLASQLWAKWRMRAQAPEGGAVVPAEPVWSLAPSFQPPEYIRGAARANPFPELTLEDSGFVEPDRPSWRPPFPWGAFLLALAAVALFAGTVALLWIERLRKKAERPPSGD